MCNFASKAFWDYYYSRKTPDQVSISICFVLAFIIIIIVSIITINIFILINLSYKDLVNLLDNDEFTQISFLGLSAQYKYKYSNDLALDYSNVLKKFQENLNSDFIITSTSNENLLRHYDDIKGNTKQYYYTYYSTKYDKGSLFSTAKFKEVFKIVSNMIPLIENYLNFYFIPENKNKIFSQILVSFSEFELIFVFSDKTLDNFNFKLKYQELMKNIIENTENTIINIQKISNQDLKSFFDQNYLIENLPVKSLEITENLQTLNTNVFDQLIHSSSFVQSSNFYNFRKQITSTVSFFSKGYSEEIFFDNTSTLIPSTFILVSDSFYNYSLLTKFQCKKLIFSGNYLIDDLKNHTFETILDCFPFVSFDDYTLSTFKDSSVFSYELNVLPKLTNLDNENIFKLITYTEVDYYNDINKVLMLSFVKKLLLNTKSYKIKRILAPFSSFSNFNYYYPATYSHNIFVLKSDGYYSTHKKYIFNNSISIFISSLILSMLASILTLFVLIFFLCFRVRPHITTPLKLIQEALTSISDKNKFKEAKNNLNDYTSPKRRDKIDEYVDLIQIILKMIEGNLNLIEEITPSMLFRLKIEENELGNEFEMINLNNIMIFEEQIIQKIEKKSHLNEILSKKIETVFLGEDLRNNEIFNNVLLKELKNKNLSGISTQNIKNELIYNTTNFVGSTLKFPFDYKIDGGLGITLMNKKDKEKDDQLKHSKESGILKSLEISSQKLDHSSKLDLDSNSSESCSSNDDTQSLNETNDLIPRQRKFNIVHPIIKKALNNDENDLYKLYKEIFN